MMAEMLDLLMAKRQPVCVKEVNTKFNESPNAHASNAIAIVASPIVGLIPTTTPNAKLQAKRRGVTPPRN
jgi:hypothetical protein